MNDKTMHIQPNGMPVGDTGRAEIERQREGRPLNHANQQQPMRPQWQSMQHAQSATGGGCPFCGAPLDADADYCESCHHYVRKDVCSFCGSPMEESESYCPECGSPRGGMECPVCHTINEFSFCKRCGSPVTELARELIATLQSNPEYRQLQQVSERLEELDKCLPFTSEADREREEMNAKLRARVLELLNADGEQVAQQPQKNVSRMSAEELARKKSESISMLTEMLEKFAIKATPTPAIARNYAMASKPQGVRLAWQCNYKHAMHSSPCGCAKPQLGGKWVILGKGMSGQVKDDK